MNTEVTTAGAAAARNKKKMDDLTVVLCALTVVGVSATAATPFWPDAWGRAPSIGVVVLAAGLAVFTALHTLYWWRGWMRPPRRRTNGPGGGAAIWALSSAAQPSSSPPSQA